MAYVAQSSQRHAPDNSYKQLFYLSVFSVVIILIGGVVASLDLSRNTPAQASQADGVSVVGSPSLAASTVDAIFKRVGSPMTGTGNVVEQASRNMQIDDAFALAVWWTETNDGEAGTGRPNGDRNPAGVRDGIGYPRDFGGYTIFPSYATAIEYWFGMIRHNYVNRGMNTVYAISYPYVGTSSSPLWAAKVIRLMFEYRGEAPPPVAIPTIMPITTVTPGAIESPVVPHGNEQHKRPTELDGRAFSGHHLAQPPAIQTSSSPSRVDAINHMGWIELGLMLFALLAVCAGAIWGMRIIRAKRSKELAATIPFSMQEPAPSWNFLSPRQGSTTLPFSLPLRTTSAYLATAQHASTSLYTTTLRTTSSLLPSYDQAGSYASEPLSYNEMFGSPDEINPVPTTEGLEVDMARVLHLSLPTVGRETDPRIRRVKLVPSPAINRGDTKSSVTREPVAVGARPAGLLTRYREMQQMS
jgi:hypothetical protein